MTGIAPRLIVATARLAEVPGSHPLSLPLCSNPHIQFDSWQFPLRIVIDVLPVAGQDHYSGGSIYSRITELGISLCPTFDSLTELMDVTAASRS